MAVDIANRNSINDISHRVNSGGNSIGSFYSGNLSGNVYDGCIRFSSVGIPQGSNIAQSILYGFNTLNSGYNYWKTTVRGINEDNAEVLSGSNPFLRSTTGNSTNYQDVMFNGYEFGFSINVTSIVQEIVNRGGWGSGHAMAFILSNNGSDYGCALSKSSYSYGDFALGTSYYPPATTTTSTTSSTTTTTSTTTSTSTTTTSTSTTTLLEDVGLKISKKGFDVKIATESQLVFSSKYAMLKTAFSGIATGPTITIVHNLGYTPTFKCYLLSGSSYVSVPYESENKVDLTYYSANAYADSTNLYITESITNQTPQTPDPTQPSSTFYYYIFYDSI